MKRARFAKGFIAMDRFHSDLMKKYRYAFYVRIGDGYSIEDYNLDYRKSRWTGGQSANVIKAPADKDYAVKFSAYGRITDATYESDLNILIYVINPDYSFMYLIGYTGNQDYKLDENIKLGFHQFTLDNGYDPIAYNNEYVNNTPIKTPTFFDSYITGRYSNSIFNRGAYYSRVHTNGKKPSIIYKPIINRSNYLDMGKTLNITPGKHSWIKQGLSNYVPMSEHEAIYLILPRLNTGVLVGYSEGFTTEEEMMIFNVLYEFLPASHIILVGQGRSESGIALYDRIDITDLTNRYGVYGARIKFQNFKSKDDEYTLDLTLGDNDSPLEAAQRTISFIDKYTISYAGNLKNPF